jgi:hypothetical protein
MSKFGLISNIQEDETKRKFQLFEAELGFEKLTALVPVENADAFEAEALKNQPKSATSFKKLVVKHGGELE